MSTKPTEPADFDTNGTNTIAVTSGHKTDGWANNEIPTSGEFNTWMRNVGDHTRYLWEGDLELGDVTADSVTVAGDVEADNLYFTSTETKQLDVHGTYGSFGVSGAGYRESTGASEIVDIVI